MAPNISIVRATFRNDLQRTYVHNAQHKFTSFQKNMREAHERMAKAAAEEIQTVLRDRVEETGRPQVARTRMGQGSNALLKAIVAEGNRYAGFQGFTVMDQTYLEGLPAVGEYYRNLEVGTEEFVGRQFRGFFILPGASRASKEAFRTQGVMVIRGPGGKVSGPVLGDLKPGQQGPQEVKRKGFHTEQAAAFGGGAYGTRRGTTSTNVISTDSLFAPVDRRKFDEEGNHVSGKGKAPLITIRNAIIGYHYVEQGMANWASSGNELAETQRAARQAGLRMEGNRIIPPPLLRP